MDNLEARNFVEPKINGELRQDTVLWRYLDAAKLFDFFENSTLFFCRADHFSDKFEGAFTPSLRDQISAAHARGEIDYDYEQFKRRMRESVFINCWHRNQDDSALGRMAAQVLHTVTRRLEAHGRAVFTHRPGSVLTQFGRVDGSYRALVTDVPVTERPPMLTVPEYLRLRQAAVTPVVRVA